MATSSHSHHHHGTNQSSGTAENDLKKLKEAIVDLYLAIKIRSTEEVRWGSVDNKMMFSLTRYMRGI
jgi:hypothetical protein